MADMIKHDGTRVSRGAKANTSPSLNNINGIYIGEVISNEDSLYTGRITVRISDFGSKETDRICVLSTPFGGHNKILDSGEDETNEAVAPISYGMWPQPPEIGTNVVVAYTGTQTQGIVLGKRTQPK